MADTTDEDKHRPDEATEEVKDTDAPAPDASSHDASAEAPAPSTTKHDETAEPAEEPKPKPKPAPASPNKIKRRPVPSALELEGTSYADGPNIAVSSVPVCVRAARAVRRVPCWLNVRLLALLQLLRGSQSCHLPIAHCSYIEHAA